MSSAAVVTGALRVKFITPVVKFIMPIVKFKCIMTIVKFANSEDPDGAIQNEPPHLEEPL